MDVTREVLHFVDHVKHGARVYVATGTKYHYSFVVLPGMRMFGSVFTLHRLDPIHTVDWTGFPAHPDEMKKHLQGLDLP